MNFYHILSNNLAIPAGQLTVHFAPYEKTSCWAGVYATDNANEIAGLEALVEAGRITALTREAYENAVRKKTEASNGYAPSLASSTPTPGAPVANVTQVVETSPTPEPVETVKPLESVDEAVTPVPVVRKPRKN